MIKLTRLDGRVFVVNAELIETFEATPETVVTMTVDKCFVVRESVEEVLERIIQYKRLIFSDWPVKKKIRLAHEETQFEWIETDGLIEAEKLDQQELKNYEQLMEESSLPSEPKKGKGS